MQEINTNFQKIQLKWQLELSNLVIIKKNIRLSKLLFPEIINLYEKIDIINRILELPQEVKHLIIQNVIWEENCPSVWNTEIPWEFKLVLTKRPNYEGSVKEFEVIGFNKTLFDFKNCYLVKEIWEILGRFETDMSHGSAAKIL